MPTECRIGCRAPSFIFLEGEVLKGEPLGKMAIPTYRTPLIPGRHGRRLHCRRGCLAFQRGRLAALIVLQLVSYWQCRSILRFMPLLRLATEGMPIHWMNPFKRKSVRPAAVLWQRAYWKSKKNQMIKL